MWCYPQLIETAENESQLHSSGKRAVLVFRGGWQDFLRLKRWESWKIRQHLRLRCLGWVGWQDWETNHIAEEELCWFGGRETCQQLTDQVGRLANSREEGVGGFPSSLVVLLPLFIQMPRLPARSQLLQAELGGPWCLVPPKAGSL